jgi:DNA-binding transcriptional regulator YdaS (Cro superfamily)
MSTSALKKAITLTGGQSALARAIGLRQCHIYNWLNRNKKVPAEHVLKIEKATKGAVTRHQLRPDIYPLHI